MQFFLCGSCSRHIKTNETACPFCGAARAATSITGQPNFQGSRDRTALLFGVAVAGAIAVGALAVGCAAEPQGPVPMYGGPPAHDIAPATSASAAAPDQTPPAVDAGAVATPTPTPTVDAGVAAEDAGHHGHTVKAPVVMYGAPPSH